MNPSIFKAYDIRGTYPDELNEDDAQKIGAAFAKYTKAKNIVVGEDARPSSPALRDAIVKGIASAGANVILTGPATTPFFYFSVATAKNAEAGVMVTASHNPAKYNGFKLVWGNATPIEPKLLLKFLAQNPKPQILNPKKKGNATEINVLDAYIKKVLSLVDVKKIRPIKIVIDAGNGMAGEILPKLLKKLPRIKSRNLFFKVDMSFPNHEANPLKEETLKKLKETVLKTKSDLGIAYDGDADRVGFVDEKGNTLRADFVFSAVLPQIFKKHPAAPVLYDLRSSKILPETIERLGGKPGMTRVGHAFIKKQMREEGAAAAAEISSHFYFKDFYGVECSDLVALYFLLQISETGKQASELVRPFAKYFQSGEINFEVKDKDAKIAAIMKKYRGDAKNFTDIDGIRLEFINDANWWWFSVRASNTEPLLRLNIETDNKKLLAQKTAELTKIIKE